MTPEAGPLAVAAEIVESARPDAQHIGGFGNGEKRPVAKIAHWKIP
jgi:hypothetical protein